MFLSFNTTLILRQGEFGIQAETITNIILISYDNIGALGFINTGESQSGDRDLYEQKRKQKRKTIVDPMVQDIHKIQIFDSSSFLFFAPPEYCRRRDTGKPRRRLGSVPRSAGGGPHARDRAGGCHPGGRPGLSCAPARTPPTPHPAHWTLGYLSCLAGWPGGNGECLEVARDTERTLVHRFKF